MTISVAARGKRRQRVDTPRSIHLRIHQIKCIKTTSELDRDETTLSIIKTTGKVTETRSGKGLTAMAEEGGRLGPNKFKKGDVKNYPAPKVGARFTLGRRKAEYPRQYHVTLLMIEEDEKAIGTVVNTAVSLIGKSAAAQVSSVAGQLAGTAASSAMSAIGAGAAAGSVVPLVGTAVGAAAAAGVASACAAIKRSRADDVFPPKHVKLHLENHPTQKGILGEKKKVNLKGHKGHYRVVYSWSAE